MIRFVPLLGRLTAACLLLVCTIFGGVALHGQGCAQDFTIRTQADADAFAQQASGCTVLTGNVRFELTETIQLPALPNIRQITGDLVIAPAAATVDINAVLNCLVGLERVTRSFSVRDGRPVSFAFPSLGFVGRGNSHESLPDGLDTIRELTFYRQVPVRFVVPAVIVTKILSVNFADTIMQELASIRFADSISYFISRSNNPLFPAGVALPPTLKNLTFDRCNLKSLRFLQGVRHVDSLSMHSAGILGWDGAQSIESIRSFHAFSQSWATDEGADRSFPNLRNVERVKWEFFPMSSLAMFSYVQSIGRIGITSWSPISLKGLRDDVEIGGFSLLQLDDDSIDVAAPWVCGALERQRISITSYGTNPMWDAWRYCDAREPGKAPQGRLFTDEDCDGVFGGSDSPLPSAELSVVELGTSSVRTLQTGPDGGYFLFGLTSGASYAITPAPRELTTVSPASLTYTHQLPASTLPDFAYCPIAQFDSVRAFSGSYVLLRDRRNPSFSYVRNLGNGSGVHTLTARLADTDGQPVDATFYLPQASRQAQWSATVTPNEEWEARHEVLVDSSYHSADTIVQCNDLEWWRGGNLIFSRSSCFNTRVYRFDGPNNLGVELVRGTPGNPQRLRYAIAIDNVVNDTALAIRVTDELPPALDASTVSILFQDSSFRYERRGQRLEWTIDSAYLVNYAHPSIVAGRVIEFEVDVLPGFGANRATIENVMGISIDGTSVRSTLAAVEQITATLEADSAPDFRLSPNPARGSVKIETESGAGVFVIYGVLGQRLLTGHLAHATTVVDVSSLPSGLYFVEIGNEIQRLILE